MSRLGTRKLLVMIVGLCAALVTPSANAAQTFISGTVAYTWVSPTGGQTLNSFTTNGTFGYTVIPEDAQPGGLGNRCFLLTNPGQTFDLDVYFYIGGDPERPWNYSEGVSAGSQPEKGRIPSGTTQAFVMISFTNAGATNIPFTLKVHDAAPC